jgi:hypothetical protein
METTRRYTLTHLMIVATAVAVATLILARLISIALSSRPADSPVKVRGGAMTFRTKSGGQFQQVGASNSYCLVLSTTSTNLTLDLFQPGNHQSNPNKSISLVPDQTQIDFFGRNEKGKIKKNGNEIRVLITSSCNGTQGTSATLTPIAHSAFYLNQKGDPSQDGDDSPDTSRSIRFQDLDCATNFLPIPQSPGAMPQNPNGDEDFCENLGLIYVNSAPTTTPTSADPWARCHNGDCSLEINVH